MISSEQFVICAFSETNESIRRRTFKVNLMALRQFISYSAAALLGVGAMLTSAIPSQATMFPLARYAAAPYVQNVDCALGAHIGPVGGCILGTDDPCTVVVEHPDNAPNPGCETKSVTRTDASGNSETKTKTNC
jgi:hypothetical protein